MTQSELNKYLETEGVDTLLDLHETSTKPTKAAIDSDLPEWVDQSLLSKTESYQVSRNYRLPIELITIINNSKTSRPTCLKLSTQILTLYYNI